MAFFYRFKHSAAELKNITCIATVGVFIAAAVVLDGYGSIRIGEFLKINFTFLPLAVIGALYGPTVGFFAGLLTDIVGYIINPIGAFLPWLVLICGLEGMIYGFILYSLKPEKTYKQLIRIVIARALDCGICNLVLNTLALYTYGFLTGDSIWALFAARIATNVITFCIGSYLMMLVIIPVKFAYNKLTVRKAIN